MENAGLAEKPPLGDFFGNRRSRRRKSAASRYRIKEKLRSGRRCASGPHVDYNARLYDPGLGRFLSVDPLIGHQGSTQSINPYSYVENNPLNKTDPTGEVSCVPSGNGKTMTCTSTPTGSHIPQTSTLNTSTGKFSGQGALPGGGLALTTDAHTTLTVTVKSNGQGQGAKAANAGKNNPSDHTKLGPSKNEMGFLKGWEKYSDHPYDSNNDGTVDTIGWGHTMSKADVKAYEGLKNAINDLPLMHGLGLGKVIADEAFTITPEQGAKFLQQDVAAAESRLMKVFPIKTLRGLKQNQYDALFDLEFNAGIHKSWNLVKDINAGKYNAAAQEFLNIDKSGSKEMGGLKTRRQEEETMFLYDKYDWSH